MTGRSRWSIAGQGDDNLLVEYGPMALDIALRLRVHLLTQAVVEGAVCRASST